MSHWNNHSFDNIFPRYHCLLTQIECIQKALEKHHFQSLICLEIKLEIELEEVLIKEKLLRQHKSRKDWIMHGDRNT